MPTPSAPARMLSKVQGPKGARQKGAVGEQDVIKTLIPLVQKAMRDFVFPEESVLKANRCIQRNQNQTAVGGNDLSHTFGISFEVKRQEALSINTWWNQCVASAAPNKELPVLVFRQNGTKWRVITFGFLWLPGIDGSEFGNMKARLEMDWDTFQLWFYTWVLRKLKNGELPWGVDN
jgi:hypothetical protein